MHPNPIGLMALEEVQGRKKRKRERGGKRREREYSAHSQRKSHVSTQGNGSCLQVKRRGLRMNHILLKPLFWTMLPSELLENKLMELSHPVCSFCYAQMRKSIQVFFLFLRNIKLILIYGFALDCYFEHSLQIAAISLVLLPSFIFFLSISS